MLLSEVDWTRRFFIHQAATWDKRATGELPGHTAYALRKKEMWETLRDAAEDTTAMMREKRSQILEAFRAAM